MSTTLSRNTILSSTFTDGLNDKQKSSRKISYATSAPLSLMLVKSYHYSVQQQRIRLDNLEIKYLAIMNTPGWFHDANLARKHNYSILGYIGEAMYASYFHAYKPAVDAELIEMVRHLLSVTTSGCYKVQRQRDTQAEGRTQSDWGQALGSASLGSEVHGGRKSLLKREAGLVA
ncbi:hypothetical protein ABEF95_012507 [Exophiala dermatitidis]